MWWYLAAAVVMMVASYVITSTMTPGQQGPKRSTFEEFDFPQADEGVPQAVVFGDVWCPDWQVLGYGDFQVETIEAEGGKK